MPEPGYVYVLFNPTLKGLVKIGRTGRDPKNRAADLSGTALPTAFEVVYDAYFADATAVEQFIHVTLTEKGVRRASNREFFEMPLRDAVKAVVAAEARFETATPIDTSGSSGEDIADSPEDICDFADALFHGHGEVLEDRERAIELYWNAASAGAVRAVLSLAEAWALGEPRIQWPELRPALQRAMDAGAVEASGYMAVGMMRSNHEANSRKCWDRFFRDFRSLPDASRMMWALRYIDPAPLDNGVAQHTEALTPDRDAILSRIGQEAPRLRLKAELMLFPERLAGLPRRRGAVHGADGDGRLMIHFGAGLIYIEPRDVPSGLTLGSGDEVEFVEHPLTLRARVIGRVQ